MDEQYSFWRGVHCFLVAVLQLWSRPKAAQKCCHYTSGERKRQRKERGRKKVREGGSRQGEFYRIICSLHEVALSHISIMCLFCLAALSLVQTLVTEGVNGQEFNFALE